MKHLLFSAAFLLSFVPLQALEPFVDGVAAAVNDEVITFSQVQDLTRGQENVVDQTYPPGETRTAKIRELRLEALNSLIERQLIIQEFRKMKGAIPAHVVDDRITVLIREQFGGDPKVFKETILKQGFTMEKLRQLEEEKIIVNAMRAREIKTDPVIAETKITAYYNEHKKEWTANDEVKFRMLKIEAGLEPEGKRQMIVEIRDKIRRGSDFADLARLYSEDSTQDKGGDWGWVKRDILYPKELENAVFSQTKGKVSDILEMNRAYYLILVEDRKEGVAKPLKEMHELIEKHLMQLERQKLQQGWLDKLRKKAYVKIY